MATAVEILNVLIEEGIAARAHFQIWWVLRNKALPDYLSAMNRIEYVDFFHAANSGNYKLFLLALSKIFDRDTRTAGIRELRQALENEGYANLAAQVEKRLSPFNEKISAICTIRNRALAHNEHSITREKVYSINGITPNEIAALIDETCKTINEVARTLGISNVIFESTRAEDATFALLKALKRTRT